MNSNTAHSPTFLIFPPEINSPEYKSSEFTAKIYYSQNFLQKFLVTKMKILGAIQILLGIMVFSFGVVFIFLLIKPYPRFPFIFISGYPFWGPALFIISGAFLIALERKSTETLLIVSRVVNIVSALGATAGIILLVFSFLLDGNYICGYSRDRSPCEEITILFTGSLILLLIFTIVELFTSLTFSIFGSYSDKDYK
ncbi:membrane-spanning 4-domains subfamily A member 5 [Dipodomys spectabilis]|uniref:membrane-spanning 4-domains subfamily A member 5 n=1 Tax=Dipodomys spectabilis TaxID=105255 RepID=UPI001C53D141|nr:membrane-spanning 4-domains subfamily A member 5 [Dipodomys spectabilis]